MVIQLVHPFRCSLLKVSGRTSRVAFDPSCVMLDYPAIKLSFTTQPWRIFYRNYFHTCRLLTQSAQVRSNITCYQGSIGP